MSLRTNRLAVLARNLGRVVGLNRRIAVWLNGRGYETRYDNGFSSTLRSGDCVWDVGANVGYYTQIFSERVGSAGRVFAFEPSPVNFARLKHACGGLSNVEIHQVGLGRENGRLALLQGGDDLGATSRVLDFAPAAAGQTVVEIRRGMDLVQMGEAAVPNAVKIDVEGFELEVLQGLGEQLGAPAVRVIGVEVHFGILQERGMADVPQQIERLLAHNGFRVRWPDSSHILATRPGS
jgi:FkbM family methyltransferase